MKKQNNKQKTAYLKLVNLTNDTPSFESICVAVLKSKDLDNYSTQRAMDDLWWVWCETYPDRHEKIINFSEKHLLAIIDYIEHE